MAGLRPTDRSPLADAALLLALFVPFLPLVASLYAHIVAFALGCPTETTTLCLFAGVDINAMLVKAVTFLRWSAETASSCWLLLYMALVAGLAQFTTAGFRGRVVRSCAVVLCAALMPLILGLAHAFAQAPAAILANPATGFALFGQVAFRWLAQIAVPLAVLVALLVALTLGYGLLIGKIISFAKERL